MSIPFQRHSLSKNKDGQENEKNKLGIDPRPRIDGLSEVSEVGVVIYRCDDYTLKENNDGIRDTRSESCQNLSRDCTK
jgi:hypothetical protein